MCSYVYIFLGTAKDLSLGPAAVMSLLTGEFATSPIEGDATYAIVLALMCGIVQFVMGVLHLGKELRSVQCSYYLNIFFRLSVCRTHLGKRNACDRSKANFGPQIYSGLQLSYLCYCSYSSNSHCQTQPSTWAGQQKTPRLLRSPARPSTGQRTRTKSDRPRQI